MKHARQGFSIKDTQRAKTQQGKELLLNIYLGYIGVRMV